MKKTGCIFLEARADEKLRPCTRKTAAEITGCFKNTNVRALPDRTFGKHSPVRPYRAKLVLTAFLLCLWAVCPQPASAAMYIVDDSGDTGTGTLREALSNNLSVGDSIVFNLADSYTIAPESTLDARGADYTIDGSNGGNPITIDGSGVTDNLFYLLQSPNPTLTLKNLTLQNNLNGRVIGLRINGEFLSLNTEGKVTFADNSITSTGISGGVIYAGGGLNITNGNDSSLTFVGNSTASYGGGIYSNGSVDITNGAGSSTVFAKNTANSGGAISIGQNLILSQGVSFGTEGDTESGNTAMDGGAIYFNMSPSQKHTIFAQQGPVGFYYNKATRSGGALYTGYNFTIDTGDEGGAIFVGNSADSSGGAIYSNAEQMTLGQEVNFGEANDPDSGNTAFSGGAICFNSTSPTTLTASAGTVGFYHNKAVGEGAVGGAIYANRNLTIDTGTTTGGAIFVGNSAASTGGAIYAKGNLTLGQGITFGTAGVAASGNTALSGGAIHFYSTSFITLTSSAGPVGFYYNKAVGEGAVGGAIYANRNLTIDTGDAGGATFVGNSAQSYGGAIYAGNDLALGQGVNFGTAGADNSASGNKAAQGGAIYQNGGSISAISGPVGFYHNQATGTNGSGGAIYANGALNIDTGTDGGAIFVGNAATTSGGAIYASSDLTLGKGITFGTEDDATSGNTALSGGAIYFQNASTLTATAEAVDFYHNKATGTSAHGGAIYANSALTINTGTAGGATFVGNSAESFGGAIYAARNLTLGQGITFGTAGVAASGNTANQGGALYLANAATLNSTAGPTGFFYNKAEGTDAAGGAIYAANSLTLNGSALFSGNSATSAGGAIYATGNLILTASGGDIHFTGNTAGAGGAANAVALGGTLGLSGGKIIFDDPLAAVAATSVNTLTSSATLVQFAGTSALSSTAGGATTVTGGEFRVLSGASFNTGGTNAAFTLNPGATLSGAGSVISSGSMILHGNIAPGGEKYTPNADLSQPGTSSGDVIDTLTLTATTVTFNGATLLIDTDENNVSDKIAVTGNVSFTGGSNNTVDVDSFRPGNYTIMDWSGSLSGGTVADNFNSVTIGGLALSGRETGILSIEDKKLLLSLINANATITWAGTNADWEKNNESIENWKLGDDTTTYFMDGDTVVFDSVGSSAPNVAVDAQGVTVAGMTVSADGYSFSSGKISGTSLTLADGDFTTTFTNELDFSSGIQVGANHTLVFEYSNAVTNNNAISGAGNLQKTGGGTLTLSGANTYTGNTTINEGGGLTITGSLGGGTYVGAITNAGTLTFNQNADQTLSGVVSISNTGSLEKQGTQTLTLAGGLNREAGDTTNAGNLNITSGTLSISGQGNYANAVTVANDAKLGLTAGDTAALNATSLVFGDTSGRLNIDGSAADGAAIVIHTTGGVTNFNAANITVGGSTGVDYQSFSAELVNGDKDIQITTALTWNMIDDTRHGTFTLTNPEDTFTVAQVLENKAANVATGWDGQGLTKAGNGTLILTATNTYTGGTTVNAGTLQIGNGADTGSIANTGGVTVASGAALAFNRSDAITYGGVISGGGSLIQQGTGVLTLSGANTYTGDTTVSAGTLKLESDLAGSDVTVTSAKLETAAVTVKSLTANGGSTVTPTGTLTVTNAASFNGATVDLSGNLGTNQISATGIVSFVTDHTTLKLGDLSSVADDAVYLLMTGASITGLDKTVTDVTLGTHRGGLYLSDSDSKLNYGLITGNTNLYWTGTGDTNWKTTQTNTNWTTGNFATWFKTNDTVFFDDTHATPGAVSVDNVGVTVAGMTVSASGYDFSGSPITGTSVLAINESTTFKNQFDFTGGATIDSGKTLTIDTSAAGWDLSTILSGDGGLTKAGSNTLTISGTNTATGTFTQAAGSVHLKSNWAGNYTQNTGTTFTSENSAKIAGNALFSGSVKPTGTLAIGGTATFDGATLNLGALDSSTWASANTITVTGQASFINATTVTVDASSATVGAYTLITYGATTSSAGAITVTASNLGAGFTGSYALSDT
ncbi:autotransporter-associated beta strand repeat-containing protein, partial [Desulfosarcina sp. OttesenSCG-928-G10]|nr:autotransporter-associated beta strand repeat-containing protein [Desulfosarcina sp. OttesenSCG-928-G10]